MSMQHCPTHEQYLDTVNHSTEQAQSTQRSPTYSEWFPLRLQKNQERLAGSVRR